jgi:dTDP-4-amino-4,6-dideoxygalactose transaminase
MAEKIFDESAEEIGMIEIPQNYKRRFTNVQAAIGLAQLMRLDQLNEKRIKNAQILLKELVTIKGLEIPVSIPGIKNIYLNLVIQNDERDKLIKKLLKRRIDTTKGYLTDCSAHPVFKDYTCNCPVANRLTQRGFYLPVYPALNERDLLFITKTIRNLLKSSN